MDIPKDVVKKVDSGNQYVEFQQSKQRLLKKMEMLNLKNIRFEDLIPWILTIEPQ